jgi:HEPN domain-containing protein
MSRATNWRVWVQYAESNWRVSSSVLEAHPNEAIVLFAASSEKYLKAALLQQKIPLLATHDLEKLMLLALPETDQMLRQSVALLGTAPERSTYPTDLEMPEQDEVQAFRNAAALIRQSVRDLLQLEDIP